MKRKAKPLLSLDLFQIFSHAQGDSSLPLLEDSYSILSLRDSQKYHLILSICYGNPDTSKMTDSEKYLLQNLRPSHIFHTKHTKKCAHSSNRSKHWIPQGFLKNNNNPFRILDTS